MKCIGITGRLTQDHKTLEIRDCLDINWHSYLRGLGFSVKHLLYSEKWDSDILLDCEGIILSGGNSLSSVCDEPLSRMRDEFETEVLRQALRNGIPLLGICRGAQLLWRYFGGHIAEIHGHAGTRHSLKFVSGMSFEVESYHDFSLCGNQPSFVTLAHGPECLVEAFHRKESKILGLMWHPERTIQDPGLRKQTDGMISDCLKDIWHA